MGIDLNKEITFGKKKNDAAAPAPEAEQQQAEKPSTSIELGKRKEKMPEKTRMNLYPGAARAAAKRQTRTIALVAVVVVIVVVVAVLVVNFVSRAATQAEIDSMKSTIATYDTQLEGYNQIHEDYLRYTDGYLSDEDKALVDRLYIMEMLTRCDYGLGWLTSVQVRENTVTAVFSTDSLDSVSSIRKNLESDSKVWFVTVDTANKSTSDSTTTVTATFTISMSQDGKQPATTSTDSTSSSSSSSSN